jgi:hypothetical protein
MKYLSWSVRRGLMWTGCWKFATDLFRADRESERDSPLYRLYFRNDNCYLLDAIIFLSLIEKQINKVVKIYLLSYRTQTQTLTWTWNLSILESKESPALCKEHRTVPMPLKMWKNSSLLDTTKSTTLCLSALSPCSEEEACYCLDMDCSSEARLKPSTGFLEYISIYFSYYTVSSLVHLSFARISLA